VTFISVGEARLDLYTDAMLLDISEGSPSAQVPAALRQGIGLPLVWQSYSMGLPL